MKQVTEYNSKTNKTSFTLRKKIRIIRVKDNTSFTVIGYKKAFEITKVPISTIQNNMNRDDKITNGYKFYDW